MPLDDSDPYWAARFRMTPQQADELRRKAEQTVREGYHATTRAMGRLREAAGRAAAPAAEAVDRFKVGVQAEMDRALMQSAADARAQARDAQRQIRRATEAVAGTPADPKPARVFTEWVTGTGPDARVLGPESAFSREFVQAPSVQGHVRSAVRDWSRKPSWRDGGAYTDYAAEFDPPEFAADLAARNGASHVIGSFDMHGARDRDGIDWIAKNKMGKHSFFGGRYWDELPIRIPHPQDAPPGEPFASTHQEIRFRTGLDGRPVK